ncbi:MAG TPA: LysE family translocator [Pseudolabrys sp.]|nr:LysE family translocator [Pseudolabrys sp.]
MNYHLFSAFLLITFVLVIVPGPIVTLVIATAATRGTRVALITVIGTTLGNAVLLACIAFGLNWILKTSAEVFEVLRWAGAAYLIWLGIQSWRSAGQSGEAAPPRRRVHISRGFLVAITNPKTIAFFTAFLPQFVDSALPVGWQLLVMCAVTVVLAGLTDAAWAVAAGLGRAWFMKPRHNALLGRLSGVALIGGGLWLSLARRTS